jgi:hypothetical protein
MRIRAFILAVLVFATGCASDRPVPTAHQISEKRAEIKGLQEQIEGLTRVLAAVSQEDLSANGAVAQARDLDDVILVLRQTKAKLVAECDRLHDEYHWPGPY